MLTPTYEQKREYINMVEAFAAEDIDPELVKIIKDTEPTVFLTWGTS